MAGVDQRGCSGGISSTTMLASTTQSALHTYSPTPIQDGPPLALEVSSTAWAAVATTSARHGKGGGQGGMRGTLDGVVDDQTWLQYNARGCPLRQQRYDSVWKFLLVVRECNLTGGGDCVEEWAYKKHDTIHQSTKYLQRQQNEWAYTQNHDSICQSTSTAHICSMAEQS